MTATFLKGDRVGSYLAELRQQFIARWDASGTLVWARRAGTSRALVLTDIAVTGEGDVYVAGEVDAHSVFEHPIERTGTFVAALTGRGLVRWVLAQHADRVLSADGGEAILARRQGSELVLARVSP